MKVSQTTKNNKILIGGVFDILHYGHIYFLKKAKKYGDFLIVALQSDRDVKRLKGVNRPIHNQNQRKEILESLKIVDEVIVLKNNMKDSDYVALVKKIRPNVIVSSEDDISLEKQKKQASLIGAKHIIIPKLKTHSTSTIAKLIGIE